MVSSKSQNTYAAKFNKRRKAKEFNVGDLILVFDDQRPGKMFPKWEGPGSVTERYHEHSYFVQMPAGNRKLVHANKLRPDQSRVMSVGVMFKEDGDFGEVECAPQPGAMRSEEVFPPRDMVAHLVERERGVICEVFKRHVEQFGRGPTVAAEYGDGVDAEAIFQCWLERCWSVMQENGALSGSAAADSVEGLDMCHLPSMVHELLQLGVKPEGRKRVSRTFGCPAVRGPPAV
ncbi:hypothetical protein MRX96_018759 [Rhipicephalus microplus]